MKYLGMALVAHDHFTYLEKGQPVHVYEYEEGEERENDYGEDIFSHYIAISDKAVRFNYGLDVDENDFCVNLKIAT